MASIRRYFTAGILTAIPLWVSWLVIAFVFGLALDVAGPIIRRLVSAVRPLSPVLAEVLGSTAIQNIISVLGVVAFIYTLGWLTTHVLGRQLIRRFEALLEKMPFVGKIYSGTKQVIDAFQTRPEAVKRVVLIEYPHPGMKTVALVTRTLTDVESGRTLLAVYVPTTPNPTSGYVEIVPEEDVTPTDWTVNEAVAFVVSGGSVGPNRVEYSFRPDAP